MTTCRGIDVSAYQSPQDWKARKAEGVVFAFAKASEGQTSRDPRFDAHIRGIIAAGLIPGAYHFAWPTQDPAREAANYIAAVRPYAKPGFVHWLDLERYSDGRNYAGRTDKQIAAWVTAWLAAVRAAFPGQRVGVYTSADDVAKGHVPADVPFWYPAYPWGPAAYSRAEAATQPKVSGRSPLIWQFTSQPIDRSIAYMSAADLRAWAAGDSTPQETDMQLSDQIHLGTWIPKYWPTDKGLQDGQIPVDVALGSGYAHARIARENSDKLVAMLAKVQAAEAAQTAAITTMAQALAKVDAAIDVPALVAEVRQAVTDGAAKALEGLNISVDVTPKES